MRRVYALLVLAVLLLTAACGGQEETAERGSVGATASTAPAETAPAETTPADTTSAENSESAELSTVLLVIDAAGGEVEVVAEVADDDAERQRGLMERTELAENAGMLFVFERERMLSFWMKNTLVPLSIAYISGDGRIVDIQDMEPLDDEKPHYASAKPAQYALEVNQGFFEERGVEVGDEVRILEEYR